MRVDKGEGATPQVLAFDNMSTRAIQGTADWTKYAVVLDVPDGATGVFLGVMVNGSGSVWMSDVKVERSEWMFRQRQPERVRRDRMDQ
jgi:hypothetical protein